MPTQREHDYGFLRGFIQAIKVIARREALGDPVNSDTPGGYAKKLQEQGFHRGASIDATDINVLAQYLYEESSTPGSGFQLILPMTGKADLVLGLRKALRRVGVDIIEKEVE